MFSLPPVAFAPVSKSALQLEIEEHAVREASEAFRAVEGYHRKEPLGERGPDRPVASSRMAVAYNDGPNGELYTVTVTVERRPGAALGVASCDDASPCNQAGDA